MGEMGSVVCEINNSLKSNIPSKLCMWLDKVMMRKLLDFEVNPAFQNVQI